MSDSFITPAQVREISQIKTLASRLSVPTTEAWRGDSPILLHFIDGGHEAGGATVTIGLTDGARYQVRTLVGTGAVPECVCQTLVWPQELDEYLRTVELPEIVEAF